MDLAAGIIIVAICTGVLYGAVYGWLFLGICLILSGIVSAMEEKLKDEK